MIYINLITIERKIETIDQTLCKEEAKSLLARFKQADPSARYYLSDKAAKGV